VDAHASQRAVLCCGKTARLQTGGVLSKLASLNPLSTSCEDGQGPQGSDMPSLM